MAPPNGSVQTRSDLRKQGMTVGALRRARASGAMTALLPGVFLVGAEKPTWEQLVEASLIWAGPGSAAAGRTAATLHGIGKFERGAVHLSVPGSPKLPRELSFDLVLYRERELAAWDLDRKAGLDLTRAERTLLDLAAELDPRTHEQLVAEAMKKKLTTPQRLRACLKRLRQRGRKGLTAMQALFDRRGYGLKRLESDLEVALLAIFQSKGLPEPVAQYEWPSKGKPDYRLDFAYPEQRLAIEADSWFHHSSEEDWSKDQTRMNELVAHGWSFLRFTPKDLSKPKEVARVVMAALTSRGYVPQAAS
ncbi:MAG: DUF559 domain-containing protein [Myxococcaceae bacterium]